MKIEIINFPMAEGSRRFEDLSATKNWYAVRLIGGRNHVDDDDVRRAPESESRGASQFHPDPA